MKDHYWNVSSNVTNERHCNKLEFIFLVDPGFYSMNLLMVGKSYLRLKNKDEGKVYLLRAKDYPVRTEDDKRVSILIFYLIL